MSSSKPLASPRVKSDMKNVHAKACQGTIVESGESPLNCDEVAE